MFDRLAEANFIQVGLRHTYLAAGVAEASPDTGGPTMASVDEPTYQRRPDHPWGEYCTLLDYIDSTIADADRKRAAIDALEDLFDAVYMTAEGA